MGRWGVASLNLKEASFFYDFVDNHYNRPITFDANTKNVDFVKSIIPYNRFKDEIVAEVDQANADFTELMVVKLLDYYKNDFFKWVNSLNCNICGKECALCFISSPLKDEQLYFASNVEFYHCRNCNVDSRFPRYNDPRKLLETRRGRCGEWTNCFAYILRCLDIDSRLVYCTTDHGWVEFYSPIKRRWIHADPCENKYDNPLLYEKEWNKEIDLVIARGEGEIRDVTWRYTAKDKIAAEKYRQEKFSEEKLGEVIRQLNVKLLSDLGDEKRIAIEKRWAEELVDLTNMRNNY